MQSKGNLLLHAVISISAVGGVLLGVLTARGELSGVVRPPWRPAALATIVAALGTFGAAAVLGNTYTASADPERILLIAILYIGAAIGAAAIARAVTQRFARPHGPDRSAE